MGGNRECRNKIRSGLNGETFDALIGRTPSYTKKRKSKTGIREKVKAAARIKAYHNMDSPLSAATVRDPAATESIRHVRCGDEVCKLEPVLTLRTATIVVANDCSVGLGAPLTVTVGALAMAEESLDAELEFVALSRVNF